MGILRGGRDGVGVGGCGCVRGGGVGLAGWEAGAAQQQRGVTLAVAGRGDGARRCTIAVVYMASQEEDSAAGAECKRVAPEAPRESCKLAGSSLEVPEPA